MKKPPPSAEDARRETVEKLRELFPDIPDSFNHETWTRPKGPTPWYERRKKPDPDRALTKQKKLGGLEGETLTQDAHFIADRLGIAYRTVREWKRCWYIPVHWWKAVRVLVFGDLGVVHEDWKGWIITVSGYLRAPDGGVFYFRPGELCSFRMPEQMRPKPPPNAAEIIARLERENDRLRKDLAHKNDFPLQADFITQKFEAIPEPVLPVEDQLAVARAQLEKAREMIEHFHHQERVREAERPRRGRHGD